MLFRRSKKNDLAFEESLGDDWSKDLEVVEVPIGNRPLFYLGVAIFLAGLFLTFRIFYLNFYRGRFYEARATANLAQRQKIPAPRGLIYDRNGLVLVENKGIFTALLDMRELLGRRELFEDTLKAIEKTLSIPPGKVLSLIRENVEEDLTIPLLLKEDLSQTELVQLKGLNLPALIVRSGFERQYKDGPIFSSVVGYVGRVSQDDLRGNLNLSGEEFIGKAGAEAFYDKSLRGQAGTVVRLRNSRGEILSEEEKNQPQIGKPLRLTIDGGFQEYFYRRMQAGLQALRRRVGIGLALNPQNGEVLALVGFPSYDNNLLSSPGRSDEKMAIFNSEDKPLFSRAVSGFYNPGSTIKPLVGLAALKEGIIDSRREIFSPGYLNVPNPYNPDQPTRFLDWRYQGNVDMARAIAQSSNIYFYTVGGGAPAQIFRTGTVDDTGYVKGLGINRLRDWWQKFNLGKLTGVDLPGESEGFLPSAEWKKKKTGKPWLLGDTYNVSIGQGDLLLTPIQLLNYISAIANGGKVYEPFVNLDSPHPKVSADLSYLKLEIKEIQKAMEMAVTYPLGTAYSLHDLGFPVAAKTGSAQVQNNAQENAIFVGYAPASGPPAEAKALADKSASKPAGNPQIAVLVLIENSIEGSLNAVPIAKDVLNWYYWNRIKNFTQKSESHSE